MAGDHSAARDVNKDVLINELDLRQVSNTTIYVKGSYFILSPSVQNSYNWFDLRLVNLKQFDRKNQKGYLLIRFFDKFLLADLRSFWRAMISKENYVKTKVSGVHWKFIIRFVNGQYIIVNQRDKKQFVIEEVTMDELREKLNRVIKKKAAVPKIESKKKPLEQPNADISLASLRGKLSEQIHLTSEVAYKKTPLVKPGRKQSKGEGLFNWLLKLFRKN
ncbi:hypothetical protein J2Y03_004914 [Neobacillus niacini]|uniref:hypothetical protein n=1 Tax=Neobacillus niacini TaxID=86668 RepID=UPI00286544AB|nr:hypothetical protein [Neobacillus niacini]MDR7079856.1 hypothetical protein [Neobacillus niacini]